MCRINASLRLIPAIVIMVLFACKAQAQKTAQHFPDSAIAQQNFVFRANWVIDYLGNRRQLTPPYELLVTSDSIDCHLPYQGRMYSLPAPVDLRLMSIRFTSKKFGYMVQPGRRSGWNITIKPADTREVQELFFNVASRGTASLAIRSTNRDRVSYEGNIEPLPH